MPTVSAERLRSWTQRVLEAAGVAERHSALIADSLVAASLRGVDSHGIHLLASYLDQIAADDVAVSETGEIVTRSGACMVYDGRNGLGQVIAEICTGHVTRLAREFGIDRSTVYRYVTRERQKRAQRKQAQ